MFECLRQHVQCVKPEDKGPRGQGFLSILIIPDLVDTHRHLFNEHEVTLAACGLGRDVPPEESWILSLNSWKQ